MLWDILSVLSRQVERSSGQLEAAYLHLGCCHSGNGPGNIWRTIEDNLQTRISMDWLMRMRLCSHRDPNIATHHVVWKVPIGRSLTHLRVPSPGQAKFTGSGLFSIRNRMLHVKLSALQWFAEFSPRLSILSIFQPHFVCKTSSHRRLPSAHTATSGPK